MRYSIVTGASRGIGEAIVKELLAAGNTVVASARSVSESLSAFATEKKAELVYVTTDLSQSKNAELFIEQAFQTIDENKCESIALINNAGMLHPIGPAGTTDHLELEKHVSLNLLAPMVMSSAFIRKTSTWNLPKTILNISSGAANHPYKGWSAYCASKAAVDMLTRVTGLEQADAKYPVKIFALAPGIVETAMQRQIRETSIAQFPDREKFVELFNNRKLQQPGVIASVIVHTLFDKRIANGAVLGIDNLTELAATA